MQIPQLQLQDSTMLLGSKRKNKEDADIDSPDGGANGSSVNGPRNSSNSI